MSHVQLHLQGEVVWGSSKPDIHGTILYIPHQRIWFTLICGGSPLRYGTSCMSYGTSFGVKFYTLDGFGLGSITYYIPGTLSGHAAMRSPDSSRTCCRRLCLPYACLTETVELSWLLVLQGWNCRTLPFPEIGRSRPVQHTKAMRPAIGLASCVGPHTHHVF